MARGNKANKRAKKRIDEARRNKPTSLSLSNVKLTAVPKELGQLKTLTELNLSNNHLSALPKELGGLKSLTKLYLSNNQLTAVPNELWELKALTALNLWRNQLPAVPKELGELKALKWLDLSNNQLTAVPKELGALKALTTLYLYSNQLTAVPKELGELKALTKLSLFDNQLTAVPKELGNLTALTKLYLYNNQLTVIPKELGDLKSLTELYLSDNKFTAVPKELGELKGLEVLDLSNNQLTAVPKELGQLKGLEVLDLSHNQLTTLPKELQQLEALKELFLHDNPALNIPEDVLGPRRHEIREKTAKPPREILDYYFSTQGDEGVALREMKLIVVGWGKAGKTTLVKRLNGIPMDPNEPETHGILISPMTIHCTDGDLKARVWDFGGQHVLHAMHEFFLTARSLYLLVIEQRGDRAEADAKYWLQLIRSYAPKAPVVVALNKSQGVARPLDKESFEKMYGPIVAWVPTECLPEAQCAGADATIAALRAALTGAAEEATMPEPRKRFPRKWVAIKDWLENLDKEGVNFLDYQAFSKGCTQRGEPDPQKQAEVAALMHDLGVAMNYARDERLRDTTVLRPDWLANGIYALLRANLFLPSGLLVPDATLTARKLGEIYAVAAREPVKMLKANDYPAEKWEFLLRLMNLFQLSFPLDESGSRQLCPTLLRAEPPPDTGEPSGDDVVRLRYEFAVVPAPLLPRFMVRTFSLIERMKLWQRGAILRYPGARARVWTTAEEKYLFVTVGGPEADRMDLLSIIRNTFIELFGEYRDLKVTEQWWFDGQWVPRKTLERFNVLQPEEEGAAVVEWDA